MGWVRWLSFLSLSLCAAAMVAALGLSHGRMASAQASASGGPAPAYTAILGAGDEYIIPPDTDVGLPIPGPPGDGLLEEDLIVVHVIHPPNDPDGLPFPIPPDWRPELCPLQKPPLNLQCTDLLADGTVNREQVDGTYTWSCDPTSQGPTALFSSTTTGLEKTAGVMFTVEEVGSAYATSGYIRVFDADLTFDEVAGNPQDTIEDAPGFFVGKGSARKPLTLKLEPSDPDKVMPWSFQDGVPHNGPPPYTLSLSPGGCVGIYSQPSGGTPLTGDALQWGWKWNVGQHKFVEQNAPTQLYVEPVSAGVCNLNLDLQFNPPEGFGDWYMGLMPYTNDSVKVTVVDVDLDIDGVDDAQEEDPGGFVAVNGLRKKILLAADPHTIGPVNLDATAGSDKVALYGAPSGGDPLGNHLHYDTGALVPTQLWVQGIAHSDAHGDVTITLDGTAGGQHFTDTVKLTVVELKSETVANTPANLARTTLGIGEPVVCYLRPAGLIADWELVGPGSLTGQDGDMRLFTASQSPSQSAVHARIAALDLVLNFNVIAPNAETVSWSADEGLGVKGPPNNSIGAKSLFSCLTGPTTVSFGWARLRERIADNPPQKVNWPDGTEETVQPWERIYTVSQSNHSWDRVWDGPHPIGRLWNGVAYVDFSFSVQVPLEYLPEVGDWVPWFPGQTHPREYKGADQSAKVGINVTNTASSRDWQGPWQ